MANPVLIEVVRGEVVESRHRGAVAVVDAEGSCILALGDVVRPVYPRSAIKALQALPLVEAGGPELLGLADEELALACSSHGGGPQHVAAAERMLARAGLDAGALECGAHWPLHHPSAFALARSGLAPSQFHNNCSGKHAGFLCLARMMKVDTRGYISPTHPVQREVKAVLQGIMGAPLDDCAVDGCSVPTWAVPLEKLAFASARFATGRGLALLRARAAARLRAACAAAPWYVAGSNRFCTAVMERFGTRIFVKTGAEGMVCAALPEQGLGLAAKIDDGAGRAAEAVMATLLARFSPSDAEGRGFLESWMRPPLRNWNGIVVGLLRPTEALRTSRSG
jgi:L-asparaginase II